MGWIGLREPWQLSNQTELSESPILLWGKFYSLLCPSAQETHPEPRGGLASDCPIGINWFVQKPFIPKAQEDLTMLFKPLWLCTCCLLSLFTWQAHTHSSRLAWIWSSPWSSHNSQSLFSPLHLLDKRDCFFLHTASRLWTHLCSWGIETLLFVCLFLSLWFIYLWVSICDIKKPSLNV